MDDCDDYFVIKGVDRNGARFRPSDWTERLAGMMASFGADRRLRFSPLLMPVLQDGIKSLRVEHALEKASPGVFGAVISFAMMNNLEIIGEVASWLLPMAS